MYESLFQDSQTELNSLLLKDGSKNKLNMRSTTKNSIDFRGTKDGLELEIEDDAFIGCVWPTTRTRKTDIV